MSTISSAAQRYRYGDLIAAVMAGTAVVERDEYDEAELIAPCEKLLTAVVSSMVVFCDWC